MKLGMIIPSIAAIELGERQHRKNQKVPTLS